MARSDGVDLARLAVSFGAVARAAGLEASVSAVTSFAEGLAAVGLENPEQVYWSGHAVFVRRPEDMPIYAQAFAAFWSGERLAAATAAVPTVTLSLDEDDPRGESASPEAEPDSPEKTIVLRYSAAELLR